MLGSLFAGAAEGLGASMVETARQKREERLRQIERDWQVQDREDDQAFRAQEAALGRDHSTAMQEDSQAFSREQTDREWGRQDEADRRAADALWGQDNPDPQSVFDREDVSEEAIGALGRLEAITGRTFNINSAHRDEQENAAAGGANRSQHIEGNAFDVDVSNLSIAERQELIRQARRAGFSGIGVYNNSLHFDVGGTRNWGPDYSSGSTPEWAMEALKEPVGRPSDRAAYDAAASSLTEGETRDEILRGLGREGDDGEEGYTSITWADDDNDGVRERWGYNRATGAYEQIPGSPSEPVPGQEAETRRQEEDAEEEVEETNREIMDAMGEDVALAGANGRQSAAIRSAVREEMDAGADLYTAIDRVKERMTYGVERNPRGPDNKYIEQVGPDSEDFDITQWDPTTLSSRQRAEDANAEGEGAGTNAQTVQEQGGNDVDPKVIEEARLALDELETLNLTDQRRAEFRRKILEDAGLDEGDL